MSGLLTFLFGDGIRTRTRAYNRGYENGFEDAMKSLELQYTKANNDLMVHFSAQYSVETMEEHQVEPMRVLEGFESTEIRDTKCTYFYPKSYIVTMRCEPRRQCYANWGTVEEKELPE